MSIKDYSYILNDDVLDIFITDEQDKTYCVASLSGCENLEDWELNNLAINIIEDMELELC